MAKRHVCIVRGDLPRGVAAAQLVHAAGHSVIDRVPAGTHAIVLVVADEDGLRAVAARLHDVGLPHHLITEPDPPWSGAGMAIGIPPTAPGDRRLRWATGGLRLLR